MPISKLPAPTAAPPTLPSGTVVTLTANHVASYTNVADLAGVGQVVDLIGTGRTQAVDLVQSGCDDCISSFF